MIYDFNDATCFNDIRCYSGWVRKYRIRSLTLYLPFIHTGTSLVYFWSTDKNCPYCTVEISEVSGAYRRPESFATTSTIGAVYVSAIQQYIFEHIRWMGKFQLFVKYYLYPSGIGHLSVSVRASVHGDFHYITLGQSIIIHGLEIRQISVSINLTNQSNMAMLVHAMTPAIMTIKQYRYNNDYVVQTFIENRVCTHTDIMRMGCHDWVCCLTDRFIHDSLLW